MGGAGSTCTTEKSEVVLPIDRELAELTGGTWSVAPIPNWRPRSICFEAPVQPHSLVIPKSSSFTSGLDLSTLDSPLASTCALIVDPQFDAPPTLPRLTVTAVRPAVTALGTWARERYRGTICAVTGTVGKSSTCDLLRHGILGQATCAAHYPDHNVFDGIGAQMLNFLEAQFAVVEVAGGPRIAQSSQLLRPHVAIVTAISAAHLEKVGTLSQVAERKTGIFAGLERGSVAIINRDIPFWEIVKDSATRHAERLISYGEHPDAGVRLVDYDAARQVATASVHGISVEYRLGLRGRHMAINSLAALAALDAMNLDLQKAASDFGSARTLRGRGQQFRLNIGGKNITLIDDSYNASPASMTAAFDLLMGIAPSGGGKRIVVLADMLELGPDAPQLHADLAERVLVTGIDRVYVTGQLMTHLWNALAGDLRGRKVESVKDFIPALEADIEDGDVILFKGSRATGLSLVALAFRDPARKSSSDSSCGSNPVDAT